jgi:hypothetical protein
MRSRILLALALAAGGLFAAACQNAEPNEGDQVQGATLPENAYVLQVSGMT